MTNVEAAAKLLITSRTTEELLNDWEATSTNEDPNIATVRGWIMDEISSRYPEKYSAWLESDDCLDDMTLREYINA